MRSYRRPDLAHVLKLRAAEVTAEEIEKHGIGARCKVPGCLSWADAYDGYCRPCAFGRTSETIVGPR